MINTSHNNNFNTCNKIPIQQNDDANQRPLFNMGNFSFKDKTKS